MGKLIDEVGDQKDKQIHLDQLKALKTEGYEAIEKDDKILLSRIVEQLGELRTKILFSNPAMWLS